MSVLPQRWPWGIRESTELPEEVQRYLADTETSALGGQLHEAVILEPIATTTVGVIACIWAILHLPPNMSKIGDVLVVAILVFLGRLAYKLWEWNYNLIFITGKRIVYAHGIITRRVAMMPLAKLTDMSYIRTPVGMVLNYGTFIVESAGQVQALSRLSPIPDPDASYRHVQNLLFGRSTQDVRLVDVTTEKKVRVDWGAAELRTRSDGGGQVEPQEDPWWKGD